MLAPDKIRPQALNLDEMDTPFLLTTLPDI